MGLLKLYFIGVLNCAPVPVFPLYWFLLSFESVRCVTNYREALYFKLMEMNNSKRQNLQFFFQNRMNHKCSSSINQI